MTTWLLPPRSGATFVTPTGSVITATLGNPTPFEDSDVNAALAQGWTYSNEAPVPQLGLLLRDPERYADQVYFCRCPMIYAGSGTMGNNGALSAVPTLTRIYARAYMYFPANVIGAAVPAGWYYVEMSSTSAGTVYNNVYSTGNVSFPASPTPFVSTGAGAFVNATATDVAGFNFNLEGGALGNNGTLRMQGFAVANNSASVKNLTPMFDSLVASQYTLTSAQWFSFNTPIRNMGEQTRQALPRQNTGGEGVGVGTNSDLNTMWNYDLSVNRNFNFKHNIAATTDFLVLHYSDVIITRLD